MKKNFIVLLVIFFTSCTTPRYIVATHDKLNNDISTYGSLPVKRYLIVPDEYESSLLSFIQHEPSRTVIELLKSNKLKKAKKHLTIQSYEDKNSTIFASALVYLIEGKYDSCSIMINELDDFSKDCFIEFLTTDCEYERDRMSGNTDFNEYQKKYQKVLDCASEDMLHKELVKMRIKLIRYGY